MSTYKEISARRRRLYELVVENRSITVERLSTLLNTSKMTVRRGLAHLVERGGTQRLHGGASLKRTSSSEPSCIVRSLDMRKEKQLIGALAAGQVKARDFILIDVGSTLLELVGNLDSIDDVTIITN